MCDIDQKIITNPDGTIEVFLKCKISGKPFTVVNEQGMFCEDLCGMVEGPLTMDDNDIFQGPENFEEKFGKYITNKFNLK